MPRIPLFITNALRAQLRDAGFTDEDIDQMTPQAAWDHVGGMPDDPLLETAMQLFDAGFAVVPILRAGVTFATKTGEQKTATGKSPSVANWQTARLSREALERAIRNANGDVAGIGVISGGLSGNLVILDFDGEGWEGVFDYVTAAWPELQQSVIVETGSGKRHVWIRCPDLPDEFTSRKFKAPLLDAIVEMRGNRSNNVAPPSIHPSGNTYTWLTDGLELVEVPFQKLHAWLMEWANESTAEPAAPIKSKITQGMRNNALTSLAGTMRRRGMGLDAIRAALLLENDQKCSPPLPADEVEEIARSVMRYEPAAPVTPDLMELMQQDNSYLITQRLDDEGNAQCLARMFANKFLFTESLGWLYYNGKYWESRGAENILDRHIVTMLTERRVAGERASREDIVKFCRSTAARVRDCKKMFTSLVWADVASFDNDKDLLNCHNGVVDLRTGQSTAHSPAQRFTYCIPIGFDPRADSTFWERWLLDTVDGDQGLSTYLQMAVGYSLTGHTKEESMFYLYGPTRSGKGTFTQTILSMLGHPLATEVDFATFTAQRDNDAQNFDLAGLKPTRFIAASESNKYQTLNAKRIKSATGGDQIRCAFKHKDLFAYWPQFKIWLSSNEMVNADVDDDAIWGRVSVIHFPHSHLGSEDKELKRKMLTRANLEGVLAWAVTGAAVWYTSLPEGLEKPRAILAETQRHRDEHDYVTQFLDEMMDVAPAGFMANRTLYPMYKTWCFDNGVTPLQQRNLTRALKRKGYLTDLRRVGTDVVRGIVGMKVRM